MRRTYFALAVAVAATAVCLTSAGSDEQGAPSAVSEIGSAIEDQVASWNSGDLSGFMRYYWRSEDMTFHGGKTRLQGWNALDSMYKRTYSGDQRGFLEFSGLEIKVLSQDCAYVLGDWKVTLPDTVKQGKFTLIWKKLDDGWRIVHDHSS